MERPVLSAPPPDTNEPANPGMPSFSDLVAMNAISSDGADDGQGDNQGTINPDNGTPAPQDKLPSDQQADANLIAKLGFKSEEELERSYKEQHATITRLSQERANIAKEMDAIRQMVIAQQNQPPVQPVQGQGDDLNAQLYKEIAPFVNNQIAQAVEYIRVADRVMAKRNANQEEFDDLNPYMTKVVAANPHLNVMPDGIEIAYNKAKELRDMNIRKNLKSVLGVDLEELRSVLKPQGSNGGNGQLSNALAAAASVPTSSGGAPSPGENKINFGEEIRKAQEAGDIDKVTKLVFLRESRKK